MGKMVGLKKRGEFQAAYRLGRSYANRLVVLYVRPTGGSPTRAGFVVGKSLTGAVAKNRARRLLREAYRLHASQVVSGFDLVLIGRAAIKGAKLQLVEPAVLDVLAKGGVLKC